jgi:hypothetical protein
MKITRIAAALCFALIATQAEASNCYVREYQGLGGAQIPIAQEPGTDQAPMAISGSAASSAAFATTTHLVRLTCGANASFVFGTSPTATTSNSPIGALLPEYFGVSPGEFVSVISNPTP